MSTTHSFLTLVALLDTPDLGDLFLDELVALVADGNDLLASYAELGDFSQNLLRDLGRRFVFGERIRIVQSVVCCWSVMNGKRMSDVEYVDVQMTSNTLMSNMMSNMTSNLVTSSVLGLAVTSRVQSSQTSQTTTASINQNRNRNGIH